MLAVIKQELGRNLEAAVRRCFGVEHSPVMEVPPRRALGDLAAPAALHLARVLKKNPRTIAGELARDLELPEAVERVQVEGAGYLNFFLHRGRVAWRVVEGTTGAAQPRPKVIVEHTNINPNKAAHIGHLRNAVLGDVLVKSLRCQGYPVEVQNYIDDTGVQLADVVVGFMDLRGLSRAEVEAQPEPFDYLCWDLYSEVGRWYEDDPGRQDLRRQTLHALERGEGPRAEMGRLVGSRVLARHILTMGRIGVTYDLLTHESDILALDFFAAAFEALKATGAVTLESEGKNAGCWVMPLTQSEEFRGLEDPDKVIVRSDGTVTYVGKDIAYQLWKFGLLGRDFHYRKRQDGIWQTTSQKAEPSHPAFGSGKRVINVIDARQSYLQKIVRAGLEALGHDREAAESHHFAYEMVALSEATARQLGFLADTAEPATSGSLEMSGRKGIGVKADDLLDQLVAKARDEIASRNRELGEDELDRLAEQIATAALRYFMCKIGTTRVLAFDLDEALSFEGESGPYLQYSLVRVKNIQRRLEEAGLPTAVEPRRVESLAPELWEEDLWDLILSVAQIDEVVERATATLELSLLARHATDLAQKFHAIYHRHPILHEQDQGRRDARLATALIFRRGLETLAGLLGICVPERM